MNSTALAEGGSTRAAPKYPYLDAGILTLVVRDGGVYELSAPGAFGLAVTCTYWKETNVRPGDDAWRYKLTQQSRVTHSGPFSHPTERGCQIAIWGHFIDIGLIGFPEDNSHLDEVDAEIVARTAKAWEQRPSSKPRRGDFVQMTDGILKRICNVTSDYVQPTTALRKSYHTCRSPSTARLVHHTG